ncbi:MAG: GNAT family N-acetyltransferase [Candidatus Bathyarchaeota archaeon]|nr:GNAT family N-acetyltransferase [Candidatus Bathyarchaeota archaeon]
MKAGRIIHRFAAKDGREVILRTPRWEDLDDILELINSLVDESAGIPNKRKLTKEQEADHLRSRLNLLEKGEAFELVAEVNGKVVANSGLYRKTAYSNHVGEIGFIGILKDYRNIGIGTEILETLIDQGKKLKPKVLFLGVFSTNSVARHVYEKVGFGETGRIPKFFHKNGKYIDDVIMAKELSALDLEQRIACSEKSPKKEKT